MASMFGFSSLAIAGVAARKREAVTSKAFISTSGQGTQLSHHQRCAACADGCSSLRSEQLYGWCIGDESTRPLEAVMRFAATFAVGALDARRCLRLHQTHRRQAIT